MAISLRPQRCGDLHLLTGGESPFDDFGPTNRAEPKPARLDADGGLAVIADYGLPAGAVGWRWTQRGPTAGSRCPMTPFSAPTPARPSRPDSRNGLWKNGVHIAYSI